MNTSTLGFFRKLPVATALAACLFALPFGAQAKDKDRGKDKKHDRDDDHDHRHDHDRYVYTSRPRSSFTLSFGSGYAGRGYYYGPPGVSYYSRQPGVTYYRTREAYYGQPAYRSDSVAAEVQRALARRGYYRGSIDGDIGPRSRNAIANYQADRGMRVTGSISSSLLQSLGID